MPEYQKAYHLNQLRRFPGWIETRVWEEPKDPQRMAQPGQPEARRPEELTDESIVYMQENLTVSESCFDTGRTIFDRITPEWEDFCRNELHFVVPDWEEESRIAREASAKREGGSTEEEAKPDSARA